MLPLTGFDYTVLLPPGANEDPTPAYLKALNLLFYFLATLTLGNPGLGERYISCSPGQVARLQDLLDSATPP